MNSHKKSTIDPEELLNHVSKVVRDISGKTMLKRKAARRRLMILAEEDPQIVIQFLESDNQKLRWEALKVLANLQNKYFIPVFIKHLHDSFSDMRWMASEGLIIIGRESLLPVIRCILENNVSLIFRDNVYLIISKLIIDNEKEDFAALLSSLGNRYIPEEKVRTNAQLVLDKLLIDLNEVEKQV
jgi:hypothetical protein